jgi:ABC-type nitrate/sulfonate/bicarbonate transport system permease component
MKKFHYLVPLGIMAVWSAITYIWQFSIIVPKPHLVATELLIYVTSSEFLFDLLPTIYKFAVGLLAGAALGISIGLMLGYFTNAYDIAVVYVDFFRGIPSTALFPLFMLFFGLGNASRIGLIIYSTTFVIMVNTIYGVRNCNPYRIMAAKIMKASRLQIIAKVIFPDSIPHILAGLRVSISLALVLKCSWGLILD